MNGLIYQALIMGRPIPSLWLCVLSRFSRAQLFVTPWTVAHQAPLSMGFSRQEYWSGLPCSPPGDLPHPGVEPRSPALQAVSLLSEPPGKPLKAYYFYPKLNIKPKIPLNIENAQQ